MTLSATQQTSLEQALVRIVYFFEMQFAGGTQYVSSLGQDLDWGGHTWSGLGGYGGMSQSEEADGVAPKSITLTLNAAQPAWLALAVGAVEDYRGLPIRIYMCPLDDGFSLIDTPQLCWAGTMDFMQIPVAKDGRASISLRCETAALGMKRHAPMRMNAGQQKQRYPTDTGFDFLPDLIAKPQLWLSRKFQVSQA